MGNCFTARLTYGFIYVALSPASASINISNNYITNVYDPTLTSNGSVYVGSITGCNCLAYETLSSSGSVAITGVC